MLKLFFVILILLFSLGSAIYFYYFNKIEDGSRKKPSFFVFFPLLILSIVLIYIDYWYFTAIGFIFIFLPILYKKLSYHNLILLSMYGAILAAYFFLMFYLNYNIYPVIFLGILSVVLICVLAILGILEHNIRKFLIYSNIIQSTFVFLDLSVAQLTGKISVLGTIQIFNYVIAGVLLFLTLGILTENGKRKSFSSLQGFYYKYKLNASFSIIAAISLAGVPGLNIFVSEWLLFKTSFGINPIITIWGIFAALLLFIMYFKIVYYLLSGEVLKKEKSPVLLKVYNGGLALFCLIFGLLPFTQIYLLEGVL